MSDWAKWAELGFRIGQWVLQVVSAFIDGDDSEPVKRLVELLPPELKADVEHARQYELTRKALEEDLRGADGA